MNFADRAQSCIARVEATLERALPRPNPGHSSLPQAMRHAVLNGGKRMRPLLAFAAAEALELPLEAADAPAAAVELVHCYSLVHDDLPAMDDDALRRGQPTVHVAFDEATAILAGDALLTLAFGVLADAGCPASVCAVLARAAGADGMVGGQALDLAFESTRPTPEALADMFGKKTGALIVAAVDMPAALEHSVDDPARRALRDYAEAIGLAFQIVDDLLDLEVATEQLGKPAGSDLEHDKATWPAVFGVDAARREAQRQRERAAAALALLPGDTDGLAWLAQRIVERRS
ncbi:MAG: polyprenyl synthetase family protein [Wenzhouxiangellaceae bacterium]|nr:polyprenyl synthetase family protein [Wenzhouxiangellaceae bacterium]